MLDPRIRVQRSRTGRGLFASEPIGKGQVIWVEATPLPVVSIRDVHTWSEKRQEWFYQYAYQVSTTKWKLLHDGAHIDPSYYMNHSCNPNCWFASDTVMIARKDIAAGGEITYDYETSQQDMDMQCQCGAAECRGRIDGSAAQTAAFQKRYKGHMLSYLQR